MRLVCPNCDAEYEVDASVIPDTGRDVQCSNCGHAWFQLPPEVEAEREAEAALYDPPPVVAGGEDEPVEAGPVESGPPRRSIDESVLAVLREEAEREAEARKTEAPPVIETQTEMGLEQAAKADAGGVVARRIARLKGNDIEPAKPQSRREMLPEIEELNSTLRSSSERRVGEAAVVAETLQDDAPRRSGFRSGFMLMIVIAAVLAVIYLMAPKLAEQFPAAASALKIYVALVDQLRHWVNGVVESAIGFLNGLIGKAG